MSYDMGFVPPALFGPGRLVEVPSRAKTLGARTALIIADPFLADAGLLDPLTAGLKAEGLDVDLFTEFSGEPKTTHVTAAARRADSVDLVIGIGGGSALDIAKSAASIAAPDADALDYAVGGKPLAARRPRLAIMIPTTAGTGSESSATNILSDPDGNKRWIWGHVTKPDLIVLDPELTVSLPPALTAWTGMDALVHAFEASTNRRTNPGGQLHGHHALQLVARALPQAVATPTDIEARGALMLGSFHAGIAIDNCNCAIAHNISHAMASFGPVHHGLATALAFEATLPWLVTQDTAELRAAATALDCSLTNLPQRITALMDACNIVRALPETCQIPGSQALAAAMTREPNLGILEVTVGAPDAQAMARAVFELLGETA
ncbi:iron-containing alcohol dehydrogenase [Pontivivens insulae]|uniref:Long-chain-alcohol dehydrogenase 1 n=1 Tax=Pontivivens insulae TaxID=1639689 RepID=A0A2R8ACN5_9RHOB|nr:iron-containing alcohol dehydrogenase [Pontivivens insulae]RED13766.1 alcohol dehydrogenase class IV [Pontivivens insulae]SPF29840.1 Long-chain-alcohol dehydrogenase 1 [Pontivivens insulae]